MVKIKLFFQGGTNSFMGSYFDIFPENVKYRALLCIKLLFSCTLPKPTSSPYFHFSRGVHHCSRGIKPQPPVISTLQPWSVRNRAKKILINYSENLSDCC